MSKPRISVVIPTRHRNDLLAQCLDCLAPGAQTLDASAYEVIVSDDGSKSTAQALVNEEYPWAQWTQGPRRGPAANRNHGAAQARGPFLAFTDDDCLPDRDWLAGFDCQISKGERVLEGKTDSTEPSGLFFAVPVNLEGGYFWSCNICLEKGIFDEIGGFDAGFPSAHLEDVDFYLRLKQAGYPSTFVPESLVLHPPREVGSIFKQVLDHESAFYMSRKHSLPLSEFSLKPTAYIKQQIRQIYKESRSLPEALRFLLTRTLVEGYLLSLYVPRWSRKYSLENNKINE